MDGRKIAFLFFLVLVGGCNDSEVQESLPTETEIAIATLQEFRDSVMRLDYESMIRVYPSSNGLDPSELEEVRDSILANFPNPERDKIVFSDRDSDRLVTVWHYEPGDSEMIYLVPLHFKNAFDGWVIDRKGSRIGSGPRNLKTVDDVLEIQQEVQPELFTLKGETGRTSRSR